MALRLRGGGASAASVVIPPEEEKQKPKKKVAMADSAAGGSSSCGGGRGGGQLLEGFDRESFETVMKRRFFFAPSFQIHGGTAGLYDYGPPGCAVKQNIIQAWREHFVLEEGMLEVDCSVLTPEPVLRASGHVERFTDQMVKDVKTGECFRADKLLSEYASSRIQTCKPPLPVDDGGEARRRLEWLVEGSEILSSSDLAEELRKWSVKSPTTGNDISDPFPFNLMFNTSIGPTGQVPGFLRPETAQGIFTNFKKLLEFNNGRLPFAAAQVGKSFRNEIAPKQGLLRVREFEMAEIEHFVRDADNGTHAKFEHISSVHLPLLPRSQQEIGGDVVNPSLGDAVKTGVVGSENMAYFMARTHSFLIRCGIDPKGVRFRQHAECEMAHYARECWDAEVLTTFGWIEVVGHADRACFDLDAHAKATGIELGAFEEYETPLEESAVKAVVDKQKVGKSFRADAKSVTEALEALAATDGQGALEADAVLEGGGVLPVVDAAGVSHQVEKGMVRFRVETRKVSGRTYTPSVIEPSFGIGRLLYAVLEHSHYHRADIDDERRTVLGLNPEISPVKCSILGLTTDRELRSQVYRIQGVLR